MKRYTADTQSLKEFNRWKWVGIRVCSGDGVTGDGCYAGEATGDKMLTGEVTGDKIVTGEAFLTREISVSLTNERNLRLNDYHAA